MATTLSTSPDTPDTLDTKAIQDTKRTPKRCLTSRKVKRKLALTLTLAGALLATGGAAQARCYLPTDQTAGWKQAPLPDGSPALAAEAGVEQFRAGEPALIWLVTDRGSVTLASHRPGKLEYLIRLDTDAWRILELTFDRALLGEKVDIVAHSAQGDVPLWLERRASGSQLHVEWGVPGVYAVSVRIHHHLREHPAVTGFRAGVYAQVSQASFAPPPFRDPRSLYYLHPGGRTVILCDAPGQALGLRQSSLAGAAPAPVRLTPR